MFFIKFENGADRLFDQITRPLLLCFFLFILVSGASIFSLSSYFLHEATKAKIVEDNVQLKQNSEHLKIVAILDAIEYFQRQPQAADSNALFLVLDNHGQKVSGNIEATSIADVSLTGWHRQSIMIGGKRRNILYKAERVDDYYTLIVGRSMHVVNQLLMTVAFSFLVCSIILYFVFRLFAHRIGHNISSRFNAIESMIEDTRLGQARTRTQDTASDEIGTLGRKVAHLLDTVDRQFNHLQDISRVIAHEFRTPLTKIKRDLQEAANNSGTVQEKILEGINNTDNLLTLSTQLLDIASHEANYTACRETVDLSTILQDVHLLFEDTIVLREVEFTVATEKALINGEPPLLARLMANVIENALEAVPNRGKIQCRIVCLRDKAIFEVLDSGPNLPSAPASIDQLIASATGKERNGIGLKMVQAIAVRHGATISIYSNQPGLKFQIAFPIVRR